jgi:tRNA 5-methylaminomethyl-2-thiouridine biosynthesis bifunctional protein
LVENLAPHDDLASCGLPDAWANQDAWTVLDTDFQHGDHFLNTWLAWQRDPLRPRMLHYVGIARVAPALPSIAQPQASGGQIQEWQCLAARCEDLGPGFHRLILEGGRVSLTLCLGDVHALLSEHVFQADTAFASAPLDKWGAQLLARRCRRGTRFCVPIAGAQLRTLMQAAGFQLDDCAPGHSRLSGSFNPRWDIPTSRAVKQHTMRAPARCAIVGAGLAGASVAHALALRGWNVTVFDTAGQPAGGASGLPVGLAVPHVSADDNPRARLSRNGCRLLAQHAERLLVQGRDWNPSGVLEHRPDGSTLWHPQACWIKPAKLLQAWLAQHGIRFVGNSTVAALQHANSLWQLQDAGGVDLGQFEVVVLANALGSQALLKSLPAHTPPGPDVQDKVAALQAMHGTLSYGSYTQTIPALPATPVNGNGCFIPHVPGSDGDQWFAGSTFETDAVLAADSVAQQAANMARLRELLPMQGADLTHALERGLIAHWSGTRCITHDRLPLVGPVDAGSGTGLWLCVGMGSRGLSFSTLCAELLAARLGGEPLPMEFSLSRSLDVNRVRRRPSAKT